LEAGDVNLSKDNGEVLPLDILTEDIKNNNTAEPAFKLGRTSGATVGQWCMIDPHCRIEQETADGTIISEGKAMVVITPREMILPKNQLGQFSGQYFSDSGDSGSGVFGRQGGIAGLLWGGLRNQEGSKAAYWASVDRLHYVTPIEWILEDMRARLREDLGSDAEFELTIL
jgi:hypothetical protein